MFKALWHETDHSHLSDIEVKNTWSYTPTPPQTLEVQFSFFYPLVYCAQGAVLWIGTDVTVSDKQMM
jgi:hypothetical protein